MVSDWPWGQWVPAIRCTPCQNIVLCIILLDRCLSFMSWTIIWHRSRWSRRTLVRALMTVHSFNFPNRSSVKWLGPMILKQGRHNHFTMCPFLFVSVFFFFFLRIYSNASSSQAYLNLYFGYACFTQHSNRWIFRFPKRFWDELVKNHLTWTVIFIMFDYMSLVLIPPNKHDL